MAFTLNTFVRNSLGLNTDVTYDPLTGLTLPRTSGVASFTYTTNDPLATVLATDYFVSVANVLALGDIIDITILGTGGTVYIENIKAVVRFSRIALFNTPPTPNVTASVRVVTQGVIQETATITAAQLLAGQVYQITSTPPANMYAVLSSLSLSLTYNTIAYTGGATLTAQYIGAPVISGTVANTFLAATASSLAIPIPVAVATTAVGTILGSALYLGASAQPAAGNSPVRVTTQYTLNLIV